MFWVCLPVIYPIAKVGGTTERERQSVCCWREWRLRAAVSDGDPIYSISAAQDDLKIEESGGRWQGETSLHAGGVWGGGFSHLDEKSNEDLRNEVEREKKQMELYVQSNMFQKHLENWRD